MTIVVGVGGVSWMCRKPCDMSETSIAILAVVEICLLVCLTLRGCGTSKICVGWDNHL
jgi:hypothetical protein